MDEAGSKARVRSLALRVSVTIGFVGLVLGITLGRMISGSDSVVTTETPPPRSPGQASEVDTEPPTIEITSRTKGLHPYKPLTIRGRMNEGKLRFEGRRVRVKDGRFKLLLPRPPDGLELVAEDKAGNRTELQVALETRRFLVRGIHVSAYAWATPSYRSSVLRAAREGSISTVELDLKDESGDIGYRSKVPLARKIGAVRAIYDLRGAIADLHASGARVIGRLVAFRDPILARASWIRGHRDRVIQTLDGRPYDNYGGFTNFANPVVRRYNQDIAEEAARLGIDDILYDYVRRPDGPLRKLKIPGLDISPERSIAGFVGTTSQRIRRYGTKLGASVYGIAATRPKEIAQSVPRLAKVVDYISPMVYPSHWARGEYNVPHPNAEPYKIVKRSLKDFLRLTEGTGAKVIPWLQDFSLGIHYGPAQVKAQIRGARDAGIKEWLLWDPHVTYNTAALR